MSKDEYPEEVELIRDDFNTADQRQATYELLEHWPGLITNLDNYARSHYQKVRDMYLGPSGSEKTFGEIREEYGSVKSWMRAQEQEAEPDIDEYMPESLSDEDKKLVRYGWMAREQAEREAKN